MPYKIFEEANLCEYVTSKFSTLERILVHISESYRVRVSISLTHLCIVVSEYVVYRHIWDSGQRVCDDTFVTVSLFEVVVCCCECCRHSELKPWLELCVEVSTYRISIEFRTDDSTFLVHEVTRNIVSNILCTALSRHLMLMLYSSLEDSVLPVCTCSEDRRVSICWVSLAFDNPSLTNVALIVFRVFSEVHDVKTLSLTINSEHAVVAELSFTSLTTLCCDKHYTVSTLCTVDSSS